MLREWHGGVVRRAAWQLRHTSCRVMHGSLCHSCVSHLGGCHLRIPWLIGCALRMPILDVVLRRATDNAGHLTSIRSRRAARILYVCQFSTSAIVVVIIRALSKPDSSGSTTAILVSEVVLVVAHLRWAHRDSVDYVQSQCTAGAPRDTKAVSVKSCCSVGHRPRECRYSCETAPRLPPRYQCSSRGSSCCYSLL